MCKYHRQSRLSARELDRGVWFPPPPPPPPPPPHPLSNPLADSLPAGYMLIFLIIFPVTFFFQVKLENHTLYIHDDKDSTDSVVVKIKLSNCVVNDWSNEQRPYVMEIRRTLGRPHYLQAQSESGSYDGIYRNYTCRQPSNLVVLRFRINIFTWK